MSKCSFTAMLFFAMLCSVMSPSLAADKKKPVDPNAANPLAEISLVKPSNDIDAPAPLALGNIVKGRLGVSSETGKYHYWVVDVPAGKYKFILDLKRADGKAEATGIDLQFFSMDGEKLDAIGHVGRLDDVRDRGVFKFETKRRLHQIVRIDNGWTISDYWLGLFPIDTIVRSPYFVDCPHLHVLVLGEKVSKTLDGTDPLSRDAYYIIPLVAGDYKLTIEVSRDDNRRDCTGLDLQVLNAEGDGEQNLIHAGQLNEFSDKKSGKLAIADDAVFIFRMRAGWTKEICKLTIKPWQDE